MCNRGDEAQQSLDTPPLVVDTEESGQPLLIEECQPSDDAVETQSSAEPEIEEEQVLPGLDSDFKVLIYKLFKRNKTE